MFATLFATPLLVVPALTTMQDDGTEGTTLRPSACDSADGPATLADHGFERETLETPVGEMVVFTAGEGEPLLLLHGLGAGASSFLWFRVAPDLAKHYRVIAPDFVGWGESVRPARPIVIEDYVQQIRFLGDWIDEPVHVAAQSLTTGYVLRAMEDDGLAVKRLILNGPSGGLDFGIDAVGEQATENFARILASNQCEEVYASIFHQRPAVEEWYRRVGFLDAENVPLELVETGITYARRPNAAYSALPFLAGTVRYDIAPLLEDLAVPTLMIWGDGEIQISPNVQARIEQVNPDIVTLRVEGARSCFEIEQPQRTIDEFLRFLRAEQ